MCALCVENSLRSPEYVVLVDLLKEQRSSAGMRQVDLANALGVQQSFVSRYEAGERRLDLVELRRICTALSTNLPEFVANFEDRLRAAKAPRRGARNAG